MGDTMTATPTDWMGNPIGEPVTITPNYDGAVLDTEAVPTGSIQTVIDWVMEGSIPERAKLAYAAEHSRDHPTKPGVTLEPRKGLLSKLTSLLSEGNDG